VADNPRIEELRRRVLKDKASIAFAQLAEEYRRAGRFEEAIDTCRSGLAHHPGYLSAHVTLGRALIETGDLPAAHEELSRVLTAAPENLAALKGLADIHYRGGERQEALAFYRQALEFAPHDPDLEHLVAQIARDLEPARPSAEVPGGLSFEEAMGEFLALHNESLPAAEPVLGEPSGAVDAVPVAPLEPVAVATLEPVPAAVAEPASVALPAPPAIPEGAAPPADEPAVEPALPSPERAAMQVEALERWLDAILASRQPK